MMDSVKITIPSHPKYLSVVRALVSRMGELSEMSEASIDKVKLAVDEACSNVIKYAYKGDAGKRIAVEFRITQEGFEVTIEDSGIKANPELIEGRSLDEVKPGGLGIHLIKRAFDVLAFDERKKKGNRLRLIRYKRGDNED
ncbi:MAG: ATP-binding protein [Nitrospirae bacterium]|nr:ATP-binding protein [Nitrospirota bacterium]MCL5238704.1 ATP-binding protein [Nitrospirota bacterium]